MTAKRAERRAGQPASGPERLVFLDETSADARMARRYGRTPRGRRPVCPVPHGPGKATTVVAALRADGLTAPMATDGAVTGDLFVADVEQVLAPTRRPGDVVVMGNLACRERAGATAAVERAGASVRYLPPYRPDLNPVENAFSELEGLLRAAEQRTVEGLWAYAGKCLDAFSPVECRNYLRHCGYGATPTSKPL